MAQKVRECSGKVDCFVTLSSFLTERLESGFIKNLLLFMLGMSGNRDFFTSIASLTHVQY